MSNSDSLKPIDVKAPSLEQAIDDGLVRLGLTRDDVIIEIMEEGSRGVLGMGARDAVVRLTPLRAPNPPSTAPAPRSAVAVQERRPAQPAPSPAKAPVPRPPAPEPADEAPPSWPTAAVEMDDREAQIAADTLSELLTKMGIHATIHTHQAEAEGADEIPPWVLDIRGPDLGVLIGRRGETLNALQYITRLIVSRELQSRVNIVIDVEGYKSRRESALRKLAVRMATQANRLGRTVTLEPMPPNERRIIHLTLRDDRSVSTESIGIGDQRKVTIIPNKSGSR
jgi:spoIIIJ-associated protein